MKPFIHCPICDRKLPLLQEETDFRYEKEYFKVTRYFYPCPKDEADFTDTATDNENLENIAVAYRKRHNLPEDHPLGISYKYPTYPPII